MDEDFWPAILFQGSVSTSQGRGVNLLYGNLSYTLKESLDLYCR